MHRASPVARWACRRMQSWSMASARFPRRPRATDRRHDCRPMDDPEELTRIIGTQKETYRSLYCENSSSAAAAACTFVTNAPSVQLFEQGELQHLPTKRIFEQEG